MVRAKQRFCPLCRRWYSWGFDFSRHSCCKKYPALRMEFGWELVETLKGKEYVDESRRIMLSTQKSESITEEKNVRRTRM